MKNILGFILVLMLSIPLALAFVSVGGDSGTVGVGSGPGGTVEVGNPSYCGNNNIDQGEQCDNTNLDGATCSSQGYDAGALTCQDSCNFDVSSCYDDNESGNDDNGDSGSGSSSSGGSSGGGGSSCDANWICTEWDTCENYTQNRMCVTECGLDRNKPLEARLCIIEGEEGDAGLGFEEEGNSGNTFISLLTGAFLGNAALSSGWPWLLVLVVIIVVLWFIIAAKRRREEERRKAALAAVAAAKRKRARKKKGAKK
jgi:hypothetical protein